MRRAVIGMGVLLTVATIAFADPREPEPGEEDQQAAREYAMNMLNLTSEIARQYARPVKRAELIEAGISGLFDATRQPMPAWIGPALKRSGDDSGELFRILTEARLEIRDPEFRVMARSLVPSFQALPKALDPHCGLVKANEFRMNTDAYEAGVGFELEGVRFAHSPGVVRQLGSTIEIAPELPTPWRVGTVVPGGPAQRAGLKPGDLITNVNGVAITPESARGVFELLQPILDDASGVGRGDFRLTVRRAGAETDRVMTLARTVFQPESVFGVRRQKDHSWNHWIDAENKIGYARIGAIDRHTPRQLVAALTELEEGGMKGLVLDLRWCPGGLLIPAAGLAESFLKDGLIASTKYRDPSQQNEREFRAGGTGLPKFMAGDYPLIVLINSDTIGGGELIAAALKDNGRAKLMGQRTRGKGSIQTAMSIPIFGQSFKLTTGTFQRPNGKEMQRFPSSTTADDWGVKPDEGMSVPMSVELSRRLRAMYDTFVLRSGTDREALPLDDPTIDPQREAARRAVMR